MPEKLTPNTSELYASPIPALGTLMKPGWGYRSPAPVMEWCGGATREALLAVGRAEWRHGADISGGGNSKTDKPNKNNGLREWRLTIQGLRKVDKAPYISDCYGYDSPLAGSMSWLLLGAGKPPSGRFSHFRATVLPRESSRMDIIVRVRNHAAWPGISCLRFSQVIGYTENNTATTLSTPSGGVAQPWWLFYARLFSRFRVGGVGC